MSENDQRRELSKASEKSLFLRESDPAYDISRWKRQGEYTLDDYYALPDDEPMELIDGVFYDMGAPLFLHQDLAKEIILQLEIQLRERGGPCRANFSPVDIILGEDRKTILQPDVFILCDRSKRRKWGVKGAPDFILEILSPSTRRKDMTVKYRKYKECGVREYWMLDIRERKMIICDLEGGKPERIIPLEGQEGLLIYQGEVKFNLDAMAVLMEEYENIPK